MGLKIFKVIWFFSLLTLLGVFMYVYASLPDPVAVGEGSQIISKEGLFYVLLAILALSNASVFAISRLLPEKDHDFKAWFYGLVVCTNLFFVITLAFVSLYNSTEKFDYPRIGFIIYGSLILLVGWSISWPIFRLAQRFLSKQAV
ncbi:MAG TPA: hypothetical protein VL728_10520 [Cyclobacteriaceae bacterium]|jgi:hypothetical protein|nr:hypothetical protein [Cyclobacteriaceae bacterium]